MQQVLLQFEDIKPFLTKSSDIGPHTRPRLLLFFEDTQKLHYLKIELAAVVDWGEPFVKATYKLEGDGPLVFTCYEAVQEVIISIQVENIRNAKAMTIKRYFPKPYNLKKANSTCQAVYSTWFRILIYSLLFLLLYWADSTS